jgi:hypothetical protein
MGVLLQGLFSRTPGNGKSPTLLPVSKRTLLGARSAVSGCGAEEAVDLFECSRRRLRT